MLQLRRSYKALSSHVCYVWKVEKWYVIFSYIIH